MAKQRRPRSKAKRKLGGKGKAPTGRASSPLTPTPSPEEEAARESKLARHREAVSTYEQGLGALQIRDFASAAAAFNSVIEKFHDEHELHDRSRVHLRVCERQTMPLMPGPTTTEELVYAATIALNNGAQDESRRHLQQAIRQDAEDEQSHYMLAIVYAQTECPDLATSHLERAVELEPENRIIARQEPDFESLREDERVQKLLKAPVRRRRRAQRPVR